MDKNSIFGLAFTTTDLFYKHDSLPSLTMGRDQTVHVSPAAGHGFVREIVIHDHARVVFLDMVLKTDTGMLIEKSPFSEKTLVSAFCVLTPQGVNIIDQDVSSEKGQASVPYIAFSMRDRELSFSVSANEVVRAVLIDFPFDTLRKECKAHDQHLCDQVRDLPWKTNVLFLDKSTGVIHHKLFELHRHAARNHADPNILAGQARSLLLDMMRTILGQHRISEENERQMYVKMDEIKDILSRHLESKLPSLPILARKVAVSESTLKRNFKHVFGTSIYEYYLQSKMEWARQLFQDKSLSVKEVAFRLGYEKPSSFIKIFKRIYHYPPGELKRRQVVH